jgi:hypothetical protein
MEREGVVEVGDNKGVSGTAGAEENKECLDAFADGVDDLCIHQTGLRYNVSQTIFLGFESSGWFTHESNDFFE